MATLDQLNGGLRLTDAAVAQQEQTLAVDLHQHAVTGDTGAQVVVQGGDHGGHQRAGLLLGAQYGHAHPLGGLQHLLKDGGARGVHHGYGAHFHVAGDVTAAHLGRQGLHVAMLGVADDLNTGGVEDLKEARQSQTGTADLGGGDHDLIEILGGVDLFKSEFLAELGEGNGIDLLHGMPPWGWSLVSPSIIPQNSAEIKGDSAFSCRFLQIFLPSECVFFRRPASRVLTFRKKCGII